MKSDRGLFDSYDVIHDVVENFTALCERSGFVGTVIGLFIWTEKRSIWSISWGTQNTAEPVFEIFPGVLNIHSIDSSTQPIT